MPTLPALALVALQLGGGSDRLLAAVPEDAVLVVALAPLDETRARAAENAWWRFARGEELQPLMRRAGEWFERALDEAFEEDEAGLRRLADPRAWLEAVHGSAAAFLTLQDDRLAGLGVWVEPGEDAAAFDELWQLLLERGSAESSLSTQEYRDVELHVLEDREPEPDSATLAILFEVAGARAVVMGEERDHVLELAQGGIDRLLGHDPAPGFAGRAALGEARQSAPEGRALECFLDAGAFMRFGMAEDERDREAGLASEPPEETQAMHELLARSGLSTMRYLHAAASIGADQRFDVSLSAHLPAGSLLQRACALLGPASRDLLELAPADALAVTSGALDVAGLWQLVLSVAAELEPAAGEQIEAGVTAFEAVAGLDLQQDVLEQLTGDFASVTVRIPPDEVLLPPELLGLETQGFLASGAATLVRVEEGAHVESVITRLLALGQLSEMVESEEYQGHTVYGLGGDEITFLRWACTDEFVLISNTPTPLRTVLARLGGEDLPTLVSDPRYQVLLEQHPGAALLSLSDARVTAEAALSAIHFLAALGEKSEAPPPEVAELVELLPHPSVVGKYVDGVIFQAFEIQPERFVMRLCGR